MMIYGNQNTNNNYTGTSGANPLCNMLSLILGALTINPPAYFSLLPSNSQQVHLQGSLVLIVLLDCSDGIQAGGTTVQTTYLSIWHDRALLQWHDYKTCPPWVDKSVAVFLLNTINTAELVYTFLECHNTTSSWLTDCHLQILFTSSTSTLSTDLQSEGSGGEYFGWYVPTEFI